MQQRIFGVSHFWFSRDVYADQPTGNWIFPIESFADLFAHGFSSPPIDSYKTKLAQFQFKTIIANKEFIPPRYPKIEKHYLYTKEEFQDFYEKHRDLKNELLVFDLETSGFDFLNDRIGCISFSFSSKTKSTASHFT